MKIGLIAVYNDSDILRACFDYHLNNGVDALAVVEHQTTEEARSIINEYKTDILYIDRIEDTTHYQEKWLKNLRQKLITKLKLNQSDWFIHFDSDEFWSGLQQLDEISADYIAVKTKPWINYMPYSTINHSIAKVKYYNIDPRHSYNLNLRKVATRAISGLNTTRGNHHATINNSETWLEPRQQVNTEIIIDHFPIRTLNQFLKKVDRGGIVTKHFKPRHDDDRRSIHWRSWIHIEDKKRFYLMNCSHIKDAESLKGKEIDDDMANRLKRLASYE